MTHQRATSRQQRACGWHANARHHRRGGVLLEALLSLVLLMMAAGFVVSAMTAAVPAVEKMQRELEATNLAVSLMSEMEIGIRPLMSANNDLVLSQEVEWNWQIEVRPWLEAGFSERIHVVRVSVRHRESGMTYQFEQLLRDLSDMDEDDDEMDLM